MLETGTAGAYARAACDIEKLPTAMAYVPWQAWEALYDNDEALKRGTVFPSLDLPFTGKEACQ